MEANKGRSAPLRFVVTLNLIHADIELSPFGLGAFK